ncbi:hypothetical protein [Povalibacter sp.]|uniref:hypothetical protein n=1 Tax=Povalibacter sp. TaxID=1962978 RepID=UPI002F42EDEA
MTYYLQPAVLAPPQPLRITRKEFEILADARQKLTAGFPVEESFDLLIGNYLELEQAALSIAASAMVHYRTEYHEFNEARAEINRRAVNFLTTARLYVDQVPQRVKACGHDNAFVRAAMNESYNNRFEYRFMEALRNHVQHNGSAVHSLSLGGGWAPRGKREWQEYAVAGYTLRHHLEQDPKFKKKVLNECPKEVDFMLAARVYLEELGRVHKLVRQTIDPTLKAARAAFDSAIMRYRRRSKSSAVGLTAYFKNKERIVTKVLVLVEWDNVRQRLEKRNGTLVNLSKRLVRSVPSWSSARASGAG